MNRPVRTGTPVRVTSRTSTTPRDVTTSIRRPARVATISKVWTPCPVSTTASTRSPFIAQRYARRIWLQSMRDDDTRDLPHARESLQFVGSRIFEDDTGAFEEVPRRGGHKDLVRSCL